MYKQRFCWSCAADLLFSVCASFFLPVVLNNSCPAPVDLSFSATVSLLPSLSLLSLCHPRFSPSRCPLFSLSVILSAFCHVSLSDRVSQKMLSLCFFPSFSPPPPSLPLSLPAVSPPRFLFLAFLSLLSITGRSCQSFCIPAASGGGGGRGQDVSGRRVRVGTDVGI